MDDVPIETLRLLAGAAARCESDPDLRERMWHALDQLLDGRSPEDVEHLVLACALSRERT